MLTYSNIELPAIVTTSVLTQIVNHILFTYNEDDIVIFSKKNIRVKYNLTLINQSKIITDVNIINQKLSLRFIDVLNFIVGNSETHTIGYFHLLKLFKLFKNISIPKLMASMPTETEWYKYLTILELIKPKSNFSYKAIYIYKTRYDFCSYRIIRDSNMEREMNITSPEPHIIAYFKQYSSLDHLLSLVQVKLISSI